MDNIVKINKSNFIPPVVSSSIKSAKIEQVQHKEEKPVSIRKPQESENYVAGTGNETVKSNLIELEYNVKNITGESVMSRKNIVNTLQNQQQVKVKTSGNAGNDSEFKQLADIGNKAMNITGEVPQSQQMQQQITPQQAMQNAQQAIKNAQQVIQNAQQAQQESPQQTEMVQKQKEHAYEQIEMAQQQIQIAQQRAQMTEQHETINQISDTLPLTQPVSQLQTQVNMQLPVTQNLQSVMIHQGQEVQQPVQPSGTSSYTVGSDVGFQQHPDTAQIQHEFPHQ